MLTEDWAVALKASSSPVRRVAKVFIGRVPFNGTVLIRAANLYKCAFEGTVWEKHRFGESTKSQVPSSKKTPNTKFQTSEKLQIPSSKNAIHGPERREAPNPKFQAPEKSQKPRSKSQKNSNPD